MSENSNEWIEEIKRIIVKEKGEFYFDRMLERIEESKRLAFLDGYLYAIHILESGLVDSTKK